MRGNSTPKCRDSPQQHSRTCAGAKRSTATARNLSSPKANNALLPPNRHFYCDAHLFVDLRHEVVTLDGETVRLTQMQYQVLALLVRQAGEVASRANFLMQIWRHVPELSPRQVDMHIKALRRKLGRYADHYIETVIGVGYRFRPLPRALGLEELVHGTRDKASEITLRPL